MTPTVERRMGERRMTVVAGGRGLGPGTVTVLRSQMVEHHIDDQVAWAEVAEAADKVAAFARSRQQSAWKRVQSWDGRPPDAA